MGQRRRQHQDTEEEALSYHIAQLEAREFDRWLTLSEKAAHKAAVKNNDAFTAAMNRAIRRGKIKVEPGTFVDTTPSTAYRIQGDVVMASGCGSPAGMCAESGGEA
jgi:hypothetical protein